MTMKSMVRTAAELKREKKSYGSINAVQEKFPWGMRLTLDDDALKKLGIDVSEMSAGSDVLLRGKARVVSVNQHADEKTTRSNMEVQITHLELSSESSFEAAFEARVKKAGRK